MTASGNIYRCKRLIRQLISKDCRWKEDIMGKKVKQISRYGEKAKFSRSIFEWNSDKKNKPNLLCKILTNTSLALHPFMLRHDIYFSTLFFHPPWINTNKTGKTLTATVIVTRLHRCFRKGRRKIKRIESKALIFQECVLKTVGRHHLPTKPFHTSSYPARQCSVMDKNQFNSFIVS